MMPGRSLSYVAFAGAVVVLGGACRPSPPRANETPSPIEAGAHSASEESLDASDAAIRALAAGDASIMEAGAASALVESDPMSSHKESRDDLLALFTIKDLTEKERKAIL